MATPRLVAIHAADMPGYFISDAITLLLLIRHDSVALFDAATPLRRHCLRWHMLRLRRYDAVYAAADRACCATMITLRC